MIEFQIDQITFEIADLGGGKLTENIAWHSHSNSSFELHFITGGAGRLITDTESYTLHRGDFFITGPNFYHKQITDTDKPTEDIFIYIQIKCGKTNDLLLSSFLSTNFCFKRNFSNKDAEKIITEYRKKQIGYKNIISALMVKLITEISRSYLPSGLIESGETENLNNKRFIIIENAFLYDTEITLKELSFRLGLCERQTQRLLQKYYGKSFRELKNRYRNMQN